MASIGKAANRAGIGSSGLGGTAGLDAVARALAQVPTGEAGEAIGPGEERMIGGHLYTNPTAAAIVVPAITTPASVLAAGFTEPTGNAENYSIWQTAADVTHPASVKGVIADTSTNAVVARVAEGQPINSEFHYARNGLNFADLYVGTGLTEAIYTRNETTGALESAPDGGIRLNDNNSFALIKRRSPTVWEVVQKGGNTLGGTSSAPSVTLVDGGTA